MLVTLQYFVPMYGWLRFFFYTQCKELRLRLILVKARCTTKILIFLFHIQFSLSLYIFQPRACVYQYFHQGCGSLVRWTGPGSDLWEKPRSGFDLLLSMNWGKTSWTNSSTIASQKTFSQCLTIKMTKKVQFFLYNLFQ